MTLVEEPGSLGDRTQRVVGAGQPACGPFQPQSSLVGPEWQPVALPKAAREIGGVDADQVSDPGHGQLLVALIVQQRQRLAEPAWGLLLMSVLRVLARPNHTRQELEHHAF